MKKLSASLLTPVNRKLISSFKVLLAMMIACRKPLSVLAPTLFPFFRHTIPNVRLAVVKTLYSFMSVSSLPRDWLSVEYLRLLFQNLTVEERSDIRDATLEAWKLVMDILNLSPGWLQSLVAQQTILDWYALMMTPMGMPMETSLFYDPALAASGSDVERHNVDKNMLAQDLTLVPAHVVIQARVSAATAMAYVIARWPETVGLECTSSLWFADIGGRDKRMK